MALWLPAFSCPETTEKYAKHPSKNAYTHIYIIQNEYNVVQTNKILGMLWKLFSQWRFISSALVYSLRHAYVYTKILVPRRSGNKNSKRETLPLHFYIHLQGRADKGHIKCSTAWAYFKWSRKKRFGVRCLGKHSLVQCPLANLRLSQKHAKCSNDPAKEILQIESRWWLWLIIN